MLTQPMALQTGNTFSSPAVMPDSTTSKKNAANPPAIMSNMQLQTAQSETYQNMSGEKVYQNKRQLIKDINAQQMYRQQMQAGASNNEGAPARTPAANLSINS